MVKRNVARIRRKRNKEQEKINAQREFDLTRESNETKMLKITRENVYSILGGLAGGTLVYGYREPIRGVGETLWSLKDGGVKAIEVLSGETSKRQARVEDYLGEELSKKYNEEKPSMLQKTEKIIGSSGERFKETPGQDSGIMKTLNRIPNYLLRKGKTEEREVKVIDRADKESLELRAQAIEQHNQTRKKLEDYVAKLEEKGYTPETITPRQKERIEGLANRCVELTDVANESDPSKLREIALERGFESEAYQEVLENAKEYGIEPGHLPTNYGGIISLGLIGALGIRYGAKLGRKISKFTKPVEDFGTYCGKRFMSPLTQKIKEKFKRN